MSPPGSASMASIRCATKTCEQHASRSSKAKPPKVFHRSVRGLRHSTVPDDWRERVRVGADRRQSGTARENLTGIRLELPKTLPDRHRRLIDYAAPGLRQLLGYA